MFLATQICDFYAHMVQSAEEVLNFEFLSNFSSSYTLWITITAALYLYLFNRNIAQQELKQPRKTYPVLRSLAAIGVLALLYYLYTCLGDIHPNYLSDTKPVLWELDENM